MRFILTKRLSLTSQKFLARKWKLVYSVVLKNGGGRRPFGTNCVIWKTYVNSNCTIATHCKLQRNNLLFISLQNIISHKNSCNISFIQCNIFWKFTDGYFCLSIVGTWFNFIQIFRQQNEELRRQVNTQQSQLTAQQKLIEKHKETSQKCLQVNKSLLIEKVSMSNVA